MLSKKFLSLSVDDRKLFIPQGWFLLCYDSYGRGCSSCDLNACKFDGRVFGYPVCYHFADQLGLYPVSCYVFKQIKYQE